MDIIIAFVCCRRTGKLRSKAEEKDHAVRLWYINKLFLILFLTVVLAAAVLNFDIYVRIGMYNENGYEKYTSVVEAIWLALYSFPITALMFLFAPGDNLNSLIFQEEFNETNTADINEIVHELPTIGTESRFGDN